MRELLLAFFLFFQITHTQAADLDLHDISILLPLPQSASLDFLPRPSTQGQHGELLPRSYFSQIPKITMHLKSSEEYSKLRAVAIRIDPCFATSAISSHCKHQVRIVWQPLEDRQGLTTVDAALHTFYDLPKSDFDRLILEIKKLKKSYKSNYSGEALRVHPILNTLGLQSAYGRALLQILFSQIGEERLSRVTFMLLRGMGNVWTFGGFDIQSGQMIPFTVPRTTQMTQSFANSLEDGFRGGLTPKPQESDVLNILLSDSRSLVSEDEPEITEATISTIRIENPNIHNAHTADCVSCHIAQPAKLWATKNYPWLNLKSKIEAYEYTSRYNTANLSTNQEKTTLMRAFGYDGNKPAINQRTINETAQALELLNSSKKYN